MRYHFTFMRIMAILKRQRWKNNPVAEKKYGAVTWVLKLLNVYFTYLVIH